jgi:hypothetical protein
MFTRAPQWRGLAPAGGRLGLSGLGDGASVAVSAAGCTVTDPTSGAATFYPECALPAGLSPSTGSLSELLSQYAGPIMTVAAVCGALWVLGGRR